MRPIGPMSRIGPIARSLARNAKQKKRQFFRSPLLQPAPQVEIITPLTITALPGTPARVTGVLFFVCRLTARTIMAETLVLAAEKREGRGSRGAGRLRKSGKIPGVVYGHKEATISVSLLHDDLTRAIRHG